MSDSTGPSTTRDSEEDEEDPYYDDSGTLNDFPSPGAKDLMGVYGDCIDDPAFAKYLAEPLPSTGGVTKA